MIREIEPGTYVIAVSGGVDSIVLLDLLVQKPGLKLVAAHFDHGIRTDSHLDRKLVQAVAKRHGLPFVHTQGFLGPDISEEKARMARYDFLRRVKEASGARAIITAHHKDDLLETAIHNVIRGTGRRGLSSHSSNDILRPLTRYPKNDLLTYASSRGLKWRDDPSNQDIRYRRNYIRHKIVPRLGREGSAQLHKLISKAHNINKQLDSEIAEVLQILEHEDSLDRTSFVKLPHIVAREVMAEWLRKNGVRQFDRKNLERLVTAAKTYRKGKKTDIDARHRLEVGRRNIKIVTR